MATAGSILLSVHRRAELYPPVPGVNAPPTSPCYYDGKPCAYNTNPCNGIIAACNTINANGVWIGAIVCAALCIIFYFIPKWPKPFGGPNHSTTRTSLILSVICAYLVYCFTFLAQFHPLIQPTRALGGGAH